MSDPMQGILNNFKPIEGDSKKILKELEKNNILLQQLVDLVGMIRDKK